MVEVAMGVDDMFDGELLFRRFQQNPVHLVAGIDNDPFPGLFTSHHITVGLHGADGNISDYQKDLLSRLGGRHKGIKLKD
jgi:hypothetical protein